MKNKNGTKQGGFDGCVCVCVLAGINGERLTEEDMLFVTVGIVSKHMYIHVQKQISNPVSTGFAKNVFHSLYNIVYFQLLSGPQVHDQVHI